MTDSLTNLEVVKPKGPKIFVGLMAVAAVGGVAWFFLGRPPGPVGEPEDASKLLLVGNEDPAAPLLEQMGFEVEELPLSEAGAAGRGAGSDAESDVDAALYYADAKGYGYVAFADAADIDFGARSVSGDSASVGEGHRYAVFSVGDFAQPTPKVTVDPNPKRYDVPPHAELVRALFEQDKLAATLVGENNLSIEAKPLFERIEPAVELQGAYGLVEQKAASAHKRLQEYVIDAEEADPKPKLLSKDVERSHAYALANGTALVLLDAPVLHNATTDDVTLEWTQDTRAWVHELKTGERTRCEAGDRIRPGNVRVDAHGAALITDWGSDELMVFTVDPKTQGCALKTAGTIDRGEGSWGHANASGKVVRAATDSGSMVAQIHTPDETHPQVWPLAGCTAVSNPIWLDATHIATACEYTPPEPAYEDPYADTEGDPPDSEDEEDAEDETPIPQQRWIYVLSVEDGSALALPLGDAHAYAPTLTLRPGTPGLTLLAENGASVVAYEFSANVAGLFSAPPLDPALAHPAFVTDASAGVRALRADAAKAAGLEVEDSLGDIVVAPDGSRMAFAVDFSGEFDRNLAVYDFTAGKTRRIAINEWARHFGPTFGPDGRTVVFNSTYSTAGFGRATVAQVVTLPGS